MFSYVHIRTYVHICKHVIVGMEVVCDQCTQMICIQANIHSTHWQLLTQWKRYKSNNDSCTGNVGESPL